MLLLLSSKLRNIIFYFWSDLVYRGKKIQSKSHLALLGSAFREIIFTQTLSSPIMEPIHPPFIQLSSSLANIITKKHPLWCFPPGLHCAVCSTTLFKQGQFSPQLGARRLYGASHDPWPCGVTLLTMPVPHLALFSLGQGYDETRFTLSGPDINFHNQVFTRALYSVLVNTHVCTKTSQLLTFVLSGFCFSRKACQDELWKWVQPQGSRPEPESAAFSPACANPRSSHSLYSGKL